METASRTVEALENVDVDTTSDSEQRENKRENTRSKIATIYVIGFLSIIIGAILVGVFKDFSIDEHKDMLLVISAILSGPLGFIIGYYFKAANE